MTEQLREIRRPGGARIAYAITRGPQRNVAPRPLLALAHGMGSNMSRWAEFVEQTTLAQSWDLLRLDLRGHGHSAWRGRIGMETWCDDLAAILDAEGCERAVVGGHCLGANLALNFGHRHPQRTRGLVLIEPMPPQALTGELRRMRPLAPLARVAALGIRALNALGIRRGELPYLDLKALDAQTRAAMAAQQSAEAMSALYASPLFDLRYMASAAYLQDLLEVWRALPPLAEIRAPVLALVAAGEHFTDPAIVAQSLAALPRLVLKRIEALHWIPTEQPQAMRAAIEQWCESLVARA